MRFDGNNNLKYDERERERVVLLFIKNIQQHTHTHIRSKRFKSIIINHQTEMLGLDTYDSSSSSSSSSDADDAMKEATTDGKRDVTAKSSSSSSSSKKLASNLFTASKKKRKELSTKSNFGMMMKKRKTTSDSMFVPPQTRTKRSNKTTEDITYVFCFRVSENKKHAR